MPLMPSYAASFRQMRIRFVSSSPFPQGFQMLTYGTPERFIGELVTRGILLSLLEPVEWAWQGLNHGARGRREFSQGNAFHLTLKALWFLNVSYVGECFAGCCESLKVRAVHRLHCGSNKFEACCIGLLSEMIGEDEWRRFESWIRRRKPQTNQRPMLKKTCLLRSFLCCWTQIGFCGFCGKHGGPRIECSHSWMCKMSTRPCWNLDSQGVFQSFLRSVMSGKFTVPSNEACQADVHFDLT